MAGPDHCQDDGLADCLDPPESLLCLLSGHANNSHQGKGNLEFFFLELVTVKPTGIKEISQ